MLPLPLGVKVAAELGGGLVLGGKGYRIGPPALHCRFKSVVPLDLVPSQDEDKDGDDDIGAQLGRGLATSGR